VEIANHYCLTPTTVRTIKSYAEKIKASIQNTSVISSNKINRTRNPLMENMEKMLCLWIEDQNQRRVPVSLSIIQFKAKSLFSKLKEEIGEESHNIEFNASRGWFERFKNRFNFHNIKVTGEAVSADQSAADAFIYKLKKNIEEGGYTPKQVFNVDETGLFWKRMPSRTYIAKEENSTPGFKAAKSRVTV